MGAIPPSFIQILLKLHWCFGHGLKICMWFGYNPQIIFCLFFRKLNLAILTGIIDNNVMDREYLVGPTPPTVLYQFFRNFMWFGYNPQINFTIQNLGSVVVECLTQDRGAAGSSLTGVTELWSLSKTHLS